MSVRNLLLAALTAVAALAGPASADPPDRVFRPDRFIPVQDRRDHQEQSIRSVREVISMLRARYGGEQVSVDLERGPRPTYFIRWRMPDGSYRDFRVDAVSGQVG